VAVAVQVFADVHGASWVQEMHAPAKQTRSVPQVEPSARAKPVSSQTEVPVAQLESPWWQGFAGVQATPAVQAAQAPALQT
jgi:hypothetical protein